MEQKIKFGTDGWRAVTDVDFTDGNVTNAVNAVAKYVFETYGQNKKILVGYDPRRKADYFAILCSSILKNKGFKVFLSDKVIPTPVLAFNAKHLNACAIMFTASHNPPEYLGLKFIPDYAGPATSNITDKIMQNLNSDLDNYSQKGEIISTDFFPAYFDNLCKIIDFKAIAEYFSDPKSQKIIFNGLYSATIGYFDKILEMNKIPFSSINLFHDINFGGGMPEPKPQYMQDLIQKISSERNTIGFANDGDGDRFGIINENGEYVTPNEIIAILLLHLKNNRNYDGALVKTVGASSMLNILAQKLNIEIIETAVGFKHVGEAMRKFNPIIAGEESGGLSIKNYIPEKDGILANLLVLEAIAYAKKPLYELQKNLHNFVGKTFINDRIDKKLESYDIVKPFMKKYSEIQTLDKYKIIKKDFTDGVKVFLEDNESSILIRPSGTEPLLRIYFETTNNEKLQKLKALFD